MEISAERRPSGQQFTPLAITVVVTVGAFFLLGAFSRQANLERSCLPFETCPNLTMPDALAAQLRAWVEWAPPFLALVLVGITLAERGWRHLFLLPAASLVLIPRLLGSQPQGLAEINWPAPYVGACAVAALASIGGAVVADRRGHRFGGLSWRELGAFGLCAVGLGVSIWVRAVRWDHSLAGPDAAVLIALFLFGSGAGMRLPWFPWAHILIPLMLSQGNAGQWWWREPSSWGAAGSFVAVAFLGALREPLGRWLARLERRPLETFLVFEALNVADALLTGLGLAEGTVEEANPVVRLVGMPAKVVIGGVAGWLLFRWRPKLLLLPTVVLFGVLVYHVGGLVVNG